jgi:hypothetical protein
VDHLDAPRVEKRARADEHGVGPLARKSRERGIDLAAGVGSEDPDLQAHGARCRFRVSHCGLGDPCIVRFNEQRNASGRRYQLAQKFQPLCRQFTRQPIDPSQVAAGPGKARDETKRDRIFRGGEDDRDCRGRGLSRKC